MSIEAPKSLGLETQVFTGEDGYRHYRELGGILDEESYRQAFLELQTVSQDALQNPDNEWWRRKFRSSTISQATGYAEETRIKLLPEQKLLACCLLESIKLVPIKDKHLLAEVFLMTNDIKNFHRFNAANHVESPRKYTPLTRVEFETLAKDYHA